MEQETNLKKSTGGISNVITLLITCLLLNSVKEFANKFLNWIHS